VWMPLFASRPAASRAIGRKRDREAFKGDFMEYSVFMSGDN